MTNNSLWIIIESGLPKDLVQTFDTLFAEKIEAGGSALSGEAPARAAINAFCTMSEPARERLIPSAEVGQLAEGERLGLYNLPHGRTSVEQPGVSGNR